MAAAEKLFEKRAFIVDCRQMLHSRCVKHKRFHIHTLRRSLVGPVQEREAHCMRMNHTTPHVQCSVARRMRARSPFTVPPLQPSHSNASAHNPVGDILEVVIDLCPPACVALGHHRFDKLHHFFLGHAHIESDSS